MLAPEHQPAAVVPAGNALPNAETTLPSPSRHRISKEPATFVGAPRWKVAVPSVPTTPWPRSDPNRASTSIRSTRRPSGGRRRPPLVQPDTDAGGHVRERSDAPQRADAPERRRSLHHRDLDRPPAIPSITDAIRRGVWRLGLRASDRTPSEDLLRESNGHVDGERPPRLSAVRERSGGLARIALGPDGERVP